MKCLLVDDEPGIREGLAALLRRRGHEVRTAVDCAAARLALQIEEFDVVVTDWRLPDGLASSFLDGRRDPVVVVSGHPEEVARTPCTVDVLTKPVVLSRLIAALEQEASRVNRLPARLPSDVQEVVDDLLQKLPATAAVELRDDGVFVEFLATMPRDGAPIRSLGGDARWTDVGGTRRLSVRLCRDGRPDPWLPRVRADEPWPVVAALAVDFHDCDLTEDQFAGCLDRVRQARLEGRRLWFLNVASGLRSFARSLGRAHDMPMKATVGPRLSLELADLWSEP